MNWRFKMGDKYIPPEAITLRDVLNTILGEILIGVYLHGSAVHGGLQKDSDIDVLAIVDNNISDTVRNELTAKLMNISGKLGNTEGKRYLELTIVKLSDIVPWTYPPNILYQYGEWLRDDFENGWIHEAQSNPDLTILLSQVLEHSATLLGSDIDRLMPPIPRCDVLRAMSDCLPELTGSLKGDERNVLLTFARIWATAATGEFLPKDKAAEWAISRLPPKHADNLMLAMNAYLGLNPDKWDKADVTATVDIMKANIKAAISSTCGEQEIL
jgi:streptomycin 3"-adenylyltransferase